MNLRNLTMLCAGLFLMSCEKECSCDQNQPSGDARTNYIGNYLVTDSAFDPNFNFNNVKTYLLQVELDENPEKLKISNFRNNGESMSAILSNQFLSIPEQYLGVGNVHGQGTGTVDGSNIKLETSINEYIGMNRINGKKQ